VANFTPPISQKSIEIFIYLTPFIPLSFKGEGEMSRIRGASPPFDPPWYGYIFLIERGKKVRKRGWRPS